MVATDYGQPEEHKLFARRREGQVVDIIVTKIPILASKYVSNIVISNNTFKCVC